MKSLGNKGSMLIEVILSLAIFSMICLPIIIFILSSEEFQSKSSRSEEKKYDMTVASNLQWFRLPNINGYSNRHSCDAAMVAYSSTTIPEITFPTGFQHDRNIITTIRNVYHNNEPRLIIGANSSSTTDPDIYVLSNIDQSILSSFDTGPGVVDLDISDGYLYGIERSVVQPLWKSPLENLLEHSTMDLTPIPISLLGALPLRISSTKDWLFLGTDKSSSTQGELLMLRRITGNTGSDGSISADSFSLHTGFEFDAGINDISQTPYELLVATPNDYEVMGLLINIPPYAANGTLSTETPSIPIGPDTGTMLYSKRFDAPGSAGNGKSLATYKGEVYIGRTVGNIEFYKLGNIIDDIAGMITSAPSVGWPFSIITTIDANRTILQIEEIFGGSYIALLIKTNQPSLRIYEKKPSGSYLISQEILLPSTPTTMTCTEDAFVIGLESTTTPMAIIKFQI